MSEPVEVRIREGDCPCPGTPHEFEVVYLEPELTLAAASGASFAMAYTDGTHAGLMRVLAESFLPTSIRSWTFQGELGPRGEPGSMVPVDRENMERLIPFDRGGLEVSERADQLYSARLMTPLLKRLPASVPRGRTGKPTSPTSLSGHKPRKSSSSSSPGDSPSNRSAASGR